MPEVQNKKIGSGTITAFIVMGAIILISFLNISIWIKLAADVVILGTFIFLKRGYIFVALGSVNFKKGRMEKAWKYLEKAVKAGVDADRRNMIGSAYIQQGDAERGVKILEDVIADPKAAEHRNVAIVTCSMGYWRLGLKDKAISSLEELRETGYRNDNLSINLETYLLETGNIKRVKEIMGENRADRTENNGLMDNRGWYYILTGEWKKAKDVFDELIDDRNAKFPEAYLHGAQVSIHEGDIKQAIDRLGWGSVRKFTLTCMTSREYFDRILMGLENPATRTSFAADMDKNFRDVSCSRPFTGFGNAVEFDKDAPDVILPDRKPAVTDRNADAVVRNTIDTDEFDTNISDQDINTDLDDDDREPNTDLDDSDLAVAATYGATVLGDDEPAPDTSVSDDDDREPNTDLDDDE